MLNAVRLLFIFFFLAPSLSYSIEIVRCPKLSTQSDEGDFLEQIKQTTLLDYGKCFQGLYMSPGEPEPDNFSIANMELGFSKEKINKLCSCKGPELFPKNLDREIANEYEEVVADLEGQVRRILDFCGLPFEQSCVEYHKSDRPVNTASSEQVREPIYTSAVEFWRNFDPYLEELREVLEPVL